MTDLIHIYQVPLQRASSEASSTSSTLANSHASHASNDLIGLADLTLIPGATKAFSIEQIPRDAGDVEVASLTLSLANEDFDLEVITTEDEQIHQESFWFSLDEVPAKKTLSIGRSSMVKILPKPPKLRIETRNVASIYYTNEIIDIDLWVRNEEDEDANVTIEARVLGSTKPLPHIKWTSPQKGGEMTEENAVDGPIDQKKDTHVSKTIGALPSSTDQSHGVRMQALSEAADYILEVRARYHLLSDPETPISKFCSTEIFVQLPFEVSYGFTPLVDPTPWPSYFDVEEIDKDSKDIEGGRIAPANGLTQKWLLTSRLYSLASEALAIENTDLRITEIHEAAVCNITSDTEGTPQSTMIASNDIQERDFILKCQKTDLEDRRSTFLDLRLGVSWHREGSQGPPTVTYLAVPELAIPFGEPRVLATARHGEVAPGVIHLEYLMENPSTYALTFNVTMDTSEEFAFSGPKNVSLGLLPLSRHSVRYNLMPLVKGSWISPQLRVFDTHFHKALKVNASEGIRSEKKGLSIWVDADG